MSADQPLHDYLIISRGHWDPALPPAQIQDAIDRFYLWYEHLLAEGTILPGSDADLVIYDLENEAVVDPSKQFNKYKWTAWAGQTYRARVCRTMVRGETVYDGEQICVEPGYGKFVSYDYGTSAAKEEVGAGSR